MDAPDARWIALALGVVLNATANILIKAGAQDQAVSMDPEGLLQLALQPAVVAGVASFALALGFYAYALTGVELSVAYPIMTSLGLVIVFLWSVTMFHETLDWPKITGTGLVLLGVVLLAVSG